MTPTIDVTLTVWCEAIKRGCTFVARITDGARGRFYSGAGDTALEAVAWAIDDYVQRAVLGRPHTMARAIDAVPGETLAMPWTPRERIAPELVVFGHDMPWRRPVPARFWAPGRDRHRILEDDDESPLDSSSAGDLRTGAQSSTPDPVDGACFDATIPRRPALVLHDEAPAPMPRAARRSR